MIRNSTIRNLNSLYNSSRCSTSKSIIIRTRDEYSSEVFLEPPFLQNSTSFISSFKTELSLLDKLKKEVDQEKAQFQRNRTARMELSSKSKVFNHTFYSIEEDIQNNTIPFYPWNDGLNYNQICSRLLYHLTHQPGAILINSSKHGELGHRFLSIYYSILYALLLKRPLYCNHYFYSLLIV